MRTYGSAMANLPPAVLGLVALFALHRGSTPMGVFGFGCALFAAPVLLVAGAPLATGGGVYALAILGSAVLWAVLGAIAARRATRRPAADWRDFWREYAWLALGVWVGVIGALVAVQLLVGGALL